MPTYNEISINVKYHHRNKQDHAKEARLEIVATDEEALYRCLCQAIKSCPGSFMRDLMSKALLQTSLKEN